ncbi:MAG: hypothetical protein EHM20_07695 [Alphaproteobacteria bacterium]|nr:MAG: hypothetical protein EHM20_07695 [Alphaproteobacteria bacterium]
MKDIFIDNNVAKNFVNPLDPEYKKLVVWLRTYSEVNLAHNAHLVVSKKIIAEYKRTCGASLSDNAVVALVDLCTRQGRLKNITNNQIKDFRLVYFTKKICRRLKSNWQDHDHIPVVLLSHRKFAISLDDNFVHDVVTFPGFQAIAVKRPQDLNYE